METITYLKTKIPSLSAVDDGRFKFTIDGDQVDNEAGLWADYVGDLPVKPRPIIHLEISDEPLEVKDESKVNAKIADLLVHFEYRSSTGRELNAYNRMVQPNQRTRVAIASAAAFLKRAAGDLAFRLNGQLLEQDGTIAEAGLFTGARIIVTDQDGGNVVNAAAGSSTGPGTQRSSSTAIDSGAARAADHRDPPADHPPRSSAPTNDSTADQRRTAVTPARQHPPTSSSLSALVSPASAGRARAVQGDRVVGPAASALVTPANSAASVGGKKRAGGDVNASDGDAGGSSPGYGERPTKKKAKVVKEKPAMPTAVRTDGERAETMQLVFKLIGDAQEGVRDEYSNGGLRLQTRREAIGPDDRLGPLLRRISSESGEHDFRTTTAAINPVLTPRSMGLSSGDTVYGLDMDIISSRSISILPPRTTDIVCKVTIPKTAQFSMIWPWSTRAPEVADNGTVISWNVRVEPSGTISVLDHRRDVPELDPSSRHASLHWAAGRDSLPNLLSDTAAGRSSYASFLKDDTTVILARLEVRGYLSQALATLGVSKDHRETVLRAWDTRLHRHEHILLRWLRSADIQRFTPIELDPPAEVVTRIFFVFKMLKTADLTEKRWVSARKRFRFGFEPTGLKELVGVPYLLQGDECLLRVVECGAMEI